MNKNIKIILCLIIIMIMLAFLVNLDIKLNRVERVNESLTVELSKTADILTSTQNTLDVTEENLIAEINRANELDEDLENANIIIESLKSEEYAIETTVTNMEIDMIAKTVWGEARGCDKMQQSAVVWCILNRVDTGYGTIAEVVSAPNQFHGYSPNFPVDENIKNLVIDVIARWKIEKITTEDVGRTLPKEYLFFRADSEGMTNIFRTKWSGECTIWNWDCWNPYS